MRPSQNTDRSVLTVIPLTLWRASNSRRCVVNGLRQTTHHFLLGCRSSSSTCIHTAAELASLTPIVNATLHMMHMPLGGRETYLAAACIVMVGVFWTSGVQAQVH